MSAAAQGLSAAAQGLDIVLLAAGMSRRFGDKNKLLTDIDGEAMVRRVAQTLRTALPHHRLIAVTGHEAEAVGAVLGDVVDALVHNRDFASGLATSVAVGIGAVAPGHGAMIVQGDMPDLGVELLKALVHTYQAGAGQAIVFPQTADGKQRTPVVWPPDLLPALSALTGDMGAKPLIARHADRVCPVPVADQRQLADFDTPQSLAGRRGGGCA